MLVDPEILRRARKTNRDAVIEVLAAQYPSTYRIAYALAGREDVGNGIVTWVMKQSFRALPRWSDEEAPQRWFRHHTLLTVRRASRWKPDVGNDTLLGEADRADSNYLAFVRAIRALPQQQVEAFLLAHGEGLDLRSLAVAMDCSTTAAAVHLKEAEQRLRSLSGDAYDALVVRLRQAYERLTPDRDLILSHVSTTVRRRFWPRFFGRLLKLLIFAAILAALLWLAWRFWTPISEWITSILTRAGLA